jgi:drug/metabolite transporter (DMT)-like permease
MAGSAITRGVLLAVAAAVAFGATIPILAWAGRGVGPLATAALLYAGAALATLALRARSRAPGPRLVRGDLPRVLGVALAGGAIAPALLAWGLQRAGATVGSLLLNLEAVFTVLLARAVFAEPIGRRVAVAVAAMVAGGAALVLDAARGAGAAVDGAAGAAGAAGALAVAAATLGWAIDNALSRPLAEREPLDVVAAKGALGAAFTLAAAVIAGEPVPPAGPALVLLACGATGYGVSLRLYLLAQRAIGAARTGSVFAVAPFIGSGIAIAIGGRAVTGWTLAAAGLFAAGVVLHLTERHGHAHVHEPTEHDHVHRHDDGHHDHTHDPPFAGEHAHPHRHDRLAHAHDHAPDLHHAHDH